MAVFDNERETHPSYGMLGFSRVSRGGKCNLFGTSITQRNTIRMTLKRGAVRRDLSQDWYSATENLFEVEMSYNQFAELITSLNMGDGIPVTIRYIGYDPVEDPPVVDRRELHRSEFEELVKKSYNQCQELITTIGDTLSKKTSFNKKEKEELMSLLMQLSHNIGSNQSFQLSQFQEQMDKTVTEAKAEVEAFVQHKMLQLAQQKLVETAPEELTSGFSVPELSSGKPTKFKKVVKP